MQHDAHNDLIMDSSLEKYDDASSERKRSELDGGDDFDDDDDDDTHSEYAKDEASKDGKLARANKRSRRHNWQPKYESEFGLIPIERDAMSADVTLAMCGFCKAFGREGRYEQLIQPELPVDSSDNKKRRRRSLTTTKFFRAFRVDNIRSHLQGAHPRRWTEYEMLPKQEAIRSRFLQMQGDFQYEGLPVVDDVLTASALSAESDIAYAHAQAHALGQHAQTSVVAAAAAAAATAVSAAPSTHPQVPHTTVATSTVSASAAAVPSTTITPMPVVRDTASNALRYPAPRSQFDYEKHLTEQLALDRERLEFEKAKFKQEVELRERELAQREQMMEHERGQREKDRAASLEKARIENSKFMRLAELLREAVAGVNGNASAGSVV
ncbi:TPA: hypothetical protein N0F65_012053 [Lagenidium giganteum]|uniref:Uncharacterized protein n=1 Tax=Lagenidium giganteum TaxID=4803 RepID=A0AAV2YPR4_9STRA|nr:TPA: hypothetical protein N0F65_012053 [Lagenidium giganteum]